MNKWNTINSLIIIIAVAAFILAIFDFIMIQDLYFELAAIRRSVVEALDILRAYGDTIKGILWRLG